MIISREKVKYLGRFDFIKGKDLDEKKVEFAWPRTSIKINFMGNKVSAELESDGDDYFLVVLDGNIYNNCFNVRKRKLYNLVDNIEYGEHTLELVKRTESFIGTCTFYGFELYDGKVLAKEEEKNIKLEVFGDSISCGYGNESDNENSEYSNKTENSYCAYGSIVARKLDADINITAWAGLGLVRNYDDSPMPLPDRIDWITPKNINRKWIFSQYIPNIVIINLGTNDFIEHPPTRDKFVDRYKSFIDKIRSYYGSINIICAIGPMIDGEALLNIRDYVKNDVVNYYNFKGINNIYFLEHEHQRHENGYGQGYHPSMKTHNIMASEIVEFIKNNKLI